MCIVNGTSAKKECNNQVSENLELLLGQLHLAEEPCDDEVDKLYNRKESLTEVCRALECMITPAAQKKCGCEGEECPYTPGWFTEIVAVSVQLFSRIFDTVNSLRKIFCCISTVAPLDGTSAICNNPSDDSEPEEDSTESFGEFPSRP